MNREMYDLFMVLFIWVITFIMTFILYYILSVNLPEMRWLNTIVVAVFGVLMGWLLGSYILGYGVIVIPLIF